MLPSNQKGLFQFCSPGLEIIASSRNYNTGLGKTMSYPSNDQKPLALHERTQVYTSLGKERGRGVCGGDK